MEHIDQYPEVRKPDYDCLLFDIDETLYPLSSGLGAQVTKNIQEYMIQKLGIEEEKVPELCLSLYKHYGTTMAGLKAIGYKFDYDDFHGFVHGRLPYEILKPDLILKSLLHSLPIRKVIFTNADKNHAARVLNRLGLEGCFEGIICFETLNSTNKTNVADDDDSSGSDSSSTSKIDIIDQCHQPKGGSELPMTPVVGKPFEDSFEQVFKIANINPRRTLFFDDSIRNIETGKRMGLHTVLVGTSHRSNGADYALESIHNIREALPELWEANEKTEQVRYSAEIAIETSVRA